MRALSLFTFVSLALCGCDDPTTPTRREIVDSAPRIDGVEVEVDDRGTVTFTAEASDPMGGEVTYAWGSRAQSPPALNEQQIVLEVDALRGYSAVAHLVVQSAAGRVAGAQMSSGPGGAFSHTMVPMSSEEPCVISHDRCISRCELARGPSEDQAFDATCATDCLIGLTLCRTNPS